MSRARQQVRQQRRAVWVGLNLELIKIIARRGWVCKYCPTRGGIHEIHADHSIPISRTTCLLPLSSYRSEAALDFSGSNKSRLVFSKGYRKLAGISLIPGQ